MLIVFQQKCSDTLHSVCYAVGHINPDFFMLIHREVAMHTNERRRNVCVTHMCGWEREHAHVYACMGVSLRVCLLAINGCGVHGGSPPKRKMNRSGRVMWLSRPFRFNYELITRHDHSAGKRAGSWGGETKENNNWEKIEGWKVLVKPFSQHVGRCQKTNKKKHEEGIFSANPQLECWEKYHT